MSLRLISAVSIATLIGISSAVLPISSHSSFAPGQAPAALSDEAAIIKAVQDVIVNMPHQMSQQMYAGPAPSPLTHSYRNPNAQVPPFTTSPIAEADFSARWNVTLHRGAGGTEVLPADQLESTFKRIPSPCGDLPEYAWGGEGGPLGPASCAGVLGRARDPGAAPPVRVWRLKQGYPRMDQKFREVAAMNPNNNASDGLINFEHTAGITSRFSFVPPPKEMHEGVAYTVSMRADGVTPADAKGAAIGNMWVQTEAKSINDGKLEGSGRAVDRGRSYYIVVPLPSNVNDKNWTTEDALTFTFEPKPSDTEFLVKFGPLGFAFDYVYEPVDDATGEDSADFEGNATAFVTTRCANIRVDVDIFATPTGPLGDSADVYARQIGVTAHQNAQEIIRILADAIQPVCKPKEALPPPPPPADRDVRVQKVTASAVHPAQAFGVSIAPSVAWGTPSRSGGASAAAVSLFLAQDATASSATSTTLTSGGYVVSEGPLPDGWSLVGFLVKPDPSGTASCSPNEPYAASSASLPPDEDAYLVCIRNDYTATPPPPPPPPPPPLRMRKLVTWYNYQTHDSLTFSTDETARLGGSGGYQYIGDAGGYVFADPNPGTVPLKLFYSDQRADYFTTATSEGERSASSAGYRLIGIEGYVYPTYQPLTVPLKLLWNAGRLDNFTTADINAEASALGSGYGLARVEGYLQISGACGLGTRWDEFEDGWTSVWTRRGDSRVFDAVSTSVSGQRATAVMTVNVAGTQVTVQREQPGYGVCTYNGTLAADGVTVSGGYTCSWWPNGGTTLWRAAIRCQ